MNALCKVTINSIKSKSMNSKIFATNFLKNITTTCTNSYSAGIKRSNYLTTNSLKYFSGKKEKKEESTDEENTENKKKEEVEETVLNEKYKELKTLYNEQQAKMEVLKKKFEELRAVYLNNVEETEQIKVRNDREVANTKEFAISKFAKDLLDVYDNFQRAMESVADKDFKILDDKDRLETYTNFLEGRFN